MKQTVELIKATLEIELSAEENNFAGLPASPTINGIQDASEKLGNFFHNQHILNNVSKVSKASKPRHVMDVMLKLNEEVGELATEIGIKTGYIQNKQPGKDGVTGEAIDAILCLMDIIILDNPQLTSTDFEMILNKKLAKWNSYNDK